jgi:hypothetical protein
MNSLYAIFEDYPRHCMLLTEGDDALPYFDSLKKTMDIDGRALLAAWVVDPDSEHADVIAVHGKVPVYIAERHRRWREGREMLSG